jgi:hypothetical protein
VLDGGGKEKYLITNKKTKIMAKPIKAPLFARAQTQEFEESVNEKSITRIA